MLRWKGLGLDLLPHNVHLVLQILITHPFIIRQIYDSLRILIALLGVFTLNVDHDDVRAIKLTIFVLSLWRSGGLALILGDGGNELYLRIAIAFTVVG